MQIDVTVEIVIQFLQAIGRRRIRWVRFSIGTEQTFSHGVKVPLKTAADILTEHERLAEHCAYCNDQD